MKQRATSITEYPSVRRAINKAVNFHCWPPKSAESLALDFARAGVDIDDVGRLVDRFTHWRSVGNWHEGIRELAMRNQNLFSRMRADLKERHPDLKPFDIADLLYAIEILGTRKLGLALREGIRHLRPLRDLVAVIHLPEETVSASLPEGAKHLDIYGIRSPGFFLGRVLFVGPDAQDVVRPGQLVMVQEQSMPYGAGELPSEDFGLEPGRRVVFVPCKMLKSPERSEELVERQNEMHFFFGRYPEGKYPKDHPFWATPRGESILVQQGEHAHHIMSILSSRGGKGRNRLMHTANENDDCVRCGFDLALTEGSKYCPRCGLPSQSCRTEAEGIMGIVEESD